jgi:puromycin-sensitive aminopeptidase
LTSNPYRLPRHVLPEHYELSISPDLETLTFDGHVSITIRVVEASDNVVLNAADLDLKSVTLVGPDGEVGVTEIKLDEDYDRATFALESTMSPGSYVLDINYTGTINDQLRGLYRSVYRDGEGQEHTIATSQCQATDARRVLPCWDEPDFKATYRTAMTVADGLEAYSNTRELSRSATDDGKVTFQFDKTIKMSTYLLAFIVGPFEATDPVEVRGIPTRIIVPKGNLHLTEYALAEAVWCLEYLADYYDIPYPGDKLDHIAIPDFAAGAMENVGLITYRDSYLILDPSVSTQAELERSLEVIAHEIAHQWFGNLVTLRWWEGAWLNEAFATFMENKAVNDRRPEWKRWLSFQADRKTWAYGTDQLLSTRPIEFEVHAPDEVDEMFDAITYGKGSAVLRQIETFIGEEAFREGVGNYLRKHAYANTASSDLWEGLDAASEWPVGEIMDTWVYQEGHPQIDVTLSGETLHISQRRFLVIPDETDTTMWQVPVLIRGVAAGDWLEKNLLLTGPDQSVELGVEPEFVMVNAGGHGFYRTRYSDDLMARLESHLSDLEPIERFTLVSDTRALVVSGQLSAASFLDLAGEFTDETEWAIWAGIIGGLADISQHALEVDAEDRFHEFSGTLLAPALQRLGLEPSVGEADLDRKLRGSLIAAMGNLAHDDGIIELSRRMVRELIAGSEVDPEAATSALGVVARHADATDFEKLWAAQEKAVTAAERVRYLRAIGSANLPGTGEFVIERILDGGIRTQDALLMVALILGARPGDDAWRSLRGKWDEVLAVLPPFTHRLIVSGIPALSKAETATDVKGFFAESEFGSESMFMKQRLELLDANVAFRERATPEVSEYFEGAH